MAEELGGRRMLEGSRKIFGGQAALEFEATMKGLANTSEGHPFSLVFRQLPEEFETLESIL